jgi:putative nucleotidyltransferase with HDIG domain
MLLGLGALVVGLLSWDFTPATRIILSSGQVARYEVAAPRQISYVSAILTEQARERAAAAVPDQYDFAEGRVRREQVLTARTSLAAVSAIRDDAQLSPEAKVDAILQLSGLGLTPEIAFQAVSMAPEDWVQVVVETPIALDRAMREEIRETGLLAAQRRAGFWIGAGLSAEAELLTTELVRALLRPNSFYNAERTWEMRQEARNSVPPQNVTLARGETILRAGDVATAEDVEALEQIGLLASQWEASTLLRALAFTVVLLATTVGALVRLAPHVIADAHNQAILVVLSVVWLLAAKFMAVPHEWLPYLYPLAAMSMLVACLVHVRVAVVTTVAVALVVHYMAGYNSLLVFYLIVGGLAGGLTLGRAERLTYFVWAALAVIVANLLALVAYQLPFAGLSNPQVLQLIFVALLNGALSASIALLGYFVLGSFFGITTALQLSELSRPTHPLLRQLLLKAPGTYHHTIVVSNMAERAAAAIGADALLARVGAYYHDIGKTVRPYFFAENIADESSPHDKLDPLTSAQIIISHVTDGIDLAQKYRLPLRIQDFIREHHGTSVVQFFYSRALRDVEDEESVDKNEFRYPGPDPRSKETAILALADTCEAAVRASRAATREDLAALVERLIDERVAEGEFNHCNLTLSDLQTVKEVFTQVLQGVHHPRISYPQTYRQAARSGEDTATAATVAATTAVTAAAEAPARPANGAEVAPSFTDRARTVALPPPGAEEVTGEPYPAAGGS